MLYLSFIPLSYRKTTTHLKDDETPRSIGNNFILCHVSDKTREGAGDKHWILESESSLLRQACG